MIKKRFDADFKSRVALEAIRGDKTLAEISSQYNVHSTQIANWKRQALTGIKEFFSHGTKTHREETDRQATDLYTQIGKLQVENDFLKKTVYPH
jgi:transposase-like protein